MPSVCKSSKTEDLFSPGSFKVSSQGVKVLTCSGLPYSEVVQINFPNRHTLLLISFQNQMSFICPCAIRIIALRSLSDRSVYTSCNIKFANIYDNLG